MRIGLIIVGDEILSGRRQDKHLPYVVQMLKQRGLLLSWSRVIGDDPELLINTYRQTLATNDLVFSTGGIGGTPDDLTREAVAAALDSHTERHPEGIEILKAFCEQHDRKLTEERYRMITFPKGATLIPNPVNTIPGFSVGDHHFVPGFPQMAWPMMEWVLDNKYPHLIDTQYDEQAVMVLNTYESAIIPIMEKLEQDYPNVKSFSLPIIHHESPKIEFGVKGNTLEVKAAMEDVKAALKEIGSEWERL
jgi:molybdenum cofactor synthesis domain-containing protein